MARSSRKILVDASMATAGGGYTYIVNIVAPLARMAPEYHFRVVTRGQKIAQALPRLDNVEVDLRAAAGLRERLRCTHVEMPRLLASWGADLYYSVGELATLRTPCPSIAAFRNAAIFWPEWVEYRWQQQIRLRLLYRLAKLTARSCDRILFVSEDSARWIGDLLGLPEERRAVVHHGIDLEAWRPKGGESPHPRPYILSVGTIYPYKSYVLLIEAWLALAARRPDLPDLVIVGDDQEPSYTRRMVETRAAAGPLAERIHIRGEVPYAEIQRYYEHAELFVFPSYIETFGHPLLESMASGIPLVATDMGSFREIAGDAAHYAEARQAAAFTQAMEEVLYDESLRTALLARGRARVSQFTWQRSAEKLLALFDEVMDAR
jgi:glycosyltransferase involved in cell wall biosynthesis